MNIFNLFKKFRKKYGHIISLGYNCETAHQFFQHYGFVESSLFTWTNTININNLIFALNNPDKLLSGEIINTNPMWRCMNTDIRFHGRADAAVWQDKSKVTDEIIQADMTELISRVHHLKEKFIQTAQDNKNNLYIFKYQVKHEDENEIKNNVLLLYKTLKKRVKNNFDLLLIFEKDSVKTNFSDNFSNYNNIYIRYVDFFAPENNVVGGECDKKGWKKIFNEFKPNYKLKMKSKLKFEEV